MQKVEWLLSAERIKAVLAVVYGVGIPLLFWANTQSSLALYLLLAVVVPMTLLFGCGTYTTEKTSEPSLGIQIKSRP